MHTFSRYLKWLFLNYDLKNDMQLLVTDSEGPRLNPHPGKFVKKQIG